MAEARGDSTRGVGYAIPTLPRAGIAVGTLVGVSAVGQGSGSLSWAIAEWQGVPNLKPTQRALAGLRLPLPDPPKGGESKAGEIQHPRSLSEP